MFCTNVECDYTFAVGDADVTLVVPDNTGSSVSNLLQITILSRSSAIEIPAITSLSPNEGQESEERATL